MKYCIKIGRIPFFTTIDEVLRQHRNILAPLGLTIGAIKQENHETCLLSSNWLPIETVPSPCHRALVDLYKAGYEVSIVMSEHPRI